jgi:alpha-glucosidase
MRRLALIALLLLPAASFADETFLGPVASWRAEGAGVILDCGGPLVRVDAVTPEIVRVRLAPGGVFEREFSYAVVPAARPAPALRVEDLGDTLVLRGAAVEIRAAKAACRLSFHDARTGALLCRDAPAFGMGWDGAKVLAYRERARDDAGLERYYGLGEKARGLEKGGERYVMWNNDFPAYEWRTDPLYQSIPFFIGLHHGLAYGIFLDNTHRTEFNMGAGNSRGLMSVSADGGELDLYVIAGPEMTSVVRRFTDLVGRSPLPPLWSLGYQQCRWSYHPEAEARRIAATFREKEIPADVIYLDIHYMDGYRVFTWDGARFPDPPRMMADLAAEGFHVVVIIDPGIKADPGYAACRDGLAGGHFCSYPDGSLFTAEVWPGECYFPDFTRPATRDWWGSLFAGLLRDGIAGFWNDMNEPGVWGGTFPPLVRHDQDGLPANHAAVHNVWGMQMARATYEGVRAGRPGERAFVLTRAGFAGVQRYSSVWTGDNVASWDHLRLSIPMLLNLGLSGVPFVGADIGGFIGSPSPELFTRWLELGVVTPLCRAHSEWGAPDKEPWSFGDRHEEMNRETIRLRYRLLPYLYREFEEATRRGLPLMRAMVLAYPEDRETFRLEDEFLFGDDILAAPVLADGARSRSVYFPAGRWLDWRSGAVHAGPVRAWVDAPLEVLPLFLREGAIVPTAPVMNHTGEKPWDPLTLDIFPGRGTSRDTLYEDDGLSDRHLGGGYARTPVEVAAGGGSVKVRIGARIGTYAPPERSLVLRVLDRAAAPRMVRLDGRALPAGRGAQGGERAAGWRFDAARRAVEVTIPDTGARAEVAIEG